MHYIAVITTTDSQPIAALLARTLVQKQLVACAQISTVESVYQWQGELQQHTEFRLWCKTTSARYADVEATIKSLHNYQLPAIYAIALTHVEPAFAVWLDEQTK